jgi:sugar O-acyltransferase (sialic acid O-acetyltransferase NeuD family)
LDIILIGGGGHCKSVIDVIEEEGKYSIIGILDKEEKLGESIYDYKIIGTDNDIEKLSGTCKNFIVTVGHIKSSTIRRNLYDRLKLLKLVLPTIISPNSYISKNALINEGTVILHNVVINTGVRIGANCIINTSCTIDHDSYIGNHSHISTATTINGNVIIGDDCFIGSGSIIKNGVNIYSEIIVGAGACVVNNIDKKGVYVGIPAKIKH